MELAYSKQRKQPDFFLFGRGPITFRVNWDIESQVRLLCPLDGLKNPW